MKDPGLICIAGLIVIAYYTYMKLSPEPQDGVFFISAVIVPLCLIAGVKYERIRKQSISPSQSEDLGDPE